VPPPKKEKPKKVRPPRDPSAPPKVYKPVEPKPPSNVVTMERMFFVKWAGLSYSECSWEWESDIVPAAQQKIDDFLKRNAPRVGPTEADDSDGHGSDDDAAASPDERAASKSASIVMQALFAVMAAKGLRQKCVVCRPCCPSR
jgi:hypothetical protein